MACQMVGGFRCTLEHGATGWTIATAHTTIRMVATLANQQGAGTDAGADFLAMATLEHATLYTSATWQLPFGGDGW